MHAEQGDHIAVRKADRRIGPMVGEGRGQTGALESTDVDLVAVREVADRLDLVGGSDDEGVLAAAADQGVGACIGGDDVVQ